MKLSRRQSRRRRALASVYALGVVVAIAASVAIGRQSGGSVVALALGLFAALLTAVTLVVLLTLDVDSQWPSLPDIVDEAYLTQWFLLAMAAITLGAFVDEGKPKWLITLAIMLSLAGGVLGSISLFHLLRISTGDGRQRFLGRLLSWRIAAAGVLPRLAPDVPYDAADGPAVIAFLTRFQDAIDSSDVAALRERVSELAIAGETLPALNMGALLALDLRVLQRLGRSIVLGRLDSPEVGGALLPRLGKVIVAHAAQVEASGATSALAGDAAQIEFATYIAQAARVFAWISAAGYADAVEKGHAPPSLCASAAGALAARDHILDVADPASAPKVALGTRWSAGLFDPKAALVWWWCFCDLNGTHDGRAFYAALWMLTGEKFYGSFGWGNRFLLSELDDRLSRDRAADSPLRTRSSEVIGQLGGVRRVALELFATSMAGWRDRRTEVPSGLEQNWSYWEDPRRLARRARLFLPRGGDPWLTSADDALDAAGFLLSRGHAQDGLAALVKRCLAPLPIVAMPPVIEPQRRSGAAVLALGAHLAPRGEAETSAELERFLGRLPAPLLEGAVSLGQAILHVAEAPATSDRAVPKLVELLAFLNHDQQDTPS